MPVSLVHNLSLGTTIHGFTVVENEYVSETGTQLIKLIHEQSGLTVFKHIPRDANYTENSANIAFATFASDDKGLPHITEHSVFCGSELYPHKDPFNEVTKTSLKVYNNAFTAQTHTVYEFASRCKRDYFNILSVYLDAVFRPALLKDPRIYAQEGWHLHLETEDGEIVQSGIVLNEMKSRCASPSTVLMYNLQRLLYGGTVMGYETGGLPDAVVTGTHADMVEFYERFYYPGNCIIAFYGNISLEDELRAIVEPYLLNYVSGGGPGLSKRPPPTPVLYKHQPNLSKSLKEDTSGQVCISNQSTRRVRFAEYGVSKETKVLKKEGIIGRIYYLFDLHDATPLLLLSIRVLDYILFDQTSSPVPERLQSSSLCKSCYSMLDCTELQCTLYLSFLGCEHTEEGYLTLINAYEDLLTELISPEKDGQYYRFLSPQAVDAALNHIELEYRDIRPYSGLGVNNRTISAALAGCPSTTRLLYEEPLQELRKLVVDGTITEYLCGILAKYLTPLNSNQADVVLVPIPGYLDHCEEATQKRLKVLKTSMSPDDIQVLVSNTKSQIRRALEPTPQEINELLPMLRIEEIDSINTDMLKAQSFLHYDLRVSPHLMPILYCHTGEQGKNLTYLEVCIDVTDMCDLETLPLLSLLANHILGEVATTSYKTVESLHRAIDYYIGDFSISLKAEDIPPFLRDVKYSYSQPISMPSRIYISISATCRDADTEAVLRLIFHEVLGGSIIGLSNPRVLLRLLHEFWMSLREDIVEGDGHLVASRRASAVRGRLTSFVYELTSGPSMYNWLSKFLRDTLADHASGTSNSEDGSGVAEEEICHSDNSFEGDDNEDEDDAFLDNDSTKQELCLLGEQLAALLTKMCARPELFLVCVGQRISNLAPYVTKTRYTSEDMSKIQSILTQHAFNKELLRVVDKSYLLRPGKLSLWVKRRNTCPLAEQFNRLLAWYHCEDQSLPLDVDLTDYSGAFNSLAIPSDVSYVARAYLPSLTENLTLGRSYLFGNIPAKYLALHIIENVYLWDNVRIKNGAYGCLLKLRLNGSAILFSYDDSRVTETIKVYDKLSESAEELYGSLDKRTLDGYKIGCLSANQLGISPKEIFKQAIYYFMTDYSVRRHYREIRQTLHVTKDALIKAHEYFSNLSSAPSVIVGSTSSCKDAFAKGLIRKYDVFE
ncbi:Metalloprotease, insulinase family [Giardia lamblia P15]|uniref:Metalloprotease, insulinase family n=1 Tax=Giardia intestinalis (strain P15) TaxID=658858 RepID=E1EYX0_GIAIA|nr:Metalloprotease, insulinase family [Giardia lamblia P15]